MHQEDIKLRLRLARQHARLAQAGLARTIGVGRSAIANWECGVAHPSTAHLARLAQATGVHFEWLATGHGPMLADEAASHAQSAALSHTEQALLEAFRTASNKRQRQILYLAMTLSTTMASALADLLAMEVA